LLTSFLTLAAIAAEPEWQVLRAPEATASSFLENNWNKHTENYHPSYVLDGNPRTAWVEGVSGDGEGEWLEVPLSRIPAARAVRLRIRNGYQKSTNLHRANAAPTRVKVELLAARGPVHTEELALDGDAEGWQTLVLTPPEPVAMRGVRLTVLAARSGTAYKDLCISDVEVAVDTGDGTYSQVFENAKHQQLLAWIAGRQQAAAFFADRPSAWPFVSAQFARASDDFLRGDDAEALARELVAIDDRWKADYGTGPYLRVDGAVPRLPDGVTLDPHAGWDSGQQSDGAYAGVLGRWLAPELTFSEAPGEWRYQKQAPMGAGDELAPFFERSSKSNDLSNIQVVRRHPDGSVAEAVFQHRRSVYFRVVEDQTWRGRVQLDANGHTQLLLWGREHRPEEGCEAGREVNRWTFGRADDGRVDHMVHEKAYECPPYGGDDADPVSWRARRTTYTPK